MNSIEDKFGNLIYRNGDNIFLELKEEKRSRKLGTIKDENIIIRRNPEKHLFLKNNSYGFNHNLLSRLNKVKNVELKSDGKRYVIPIDYILKYGEFMNFKNQGFELQIFLKLDLINQFKTIEQ